MNSKNYYDIWKFEKILIKFRENMEIFWKMFQEILFCMYANFKSDKKEMIVH